MYAKGDSVVSLQHTPVTILVQPLIIGWQMV